MLALVAGMVVLAAALPLSVAATEPAALCEATKLKATGKLGAAVLGCHAKTLPFGLPVDAECLGKGTASLTKAFSKAEEREGCATIGDNGLAEAKVNEVTAVLLSALAVTALSVVHPGPPGAKGSYPYESTATGGSPSATTS